MKHHSRIASLSRRRVLRGMLNGGAVTLGLPLLNCFLNDSGTAMASGAPLPLRFGTWFWGLGMAQKIFVPKKTGANYELLEENSMLAPVKDKINLLTNFTAFRDTYLPSDHVDLVDLVVDEKSVLFQVATIINTDKNDVRVPTWVTDPASDFTAEGAVIPLTEGAVGELVIKPVNDALLATAPEQAGPQSRAMIVRWGTLHAMRTALGALATLGFLWANLSG